VRLRGILQVAVHFWQRNRMEKIKKNIQKLAILKINGIKIKNQTSVIIAKK